MPAVTSGQVLVTGANGYLAAWAVKTLLQEGYSVLGVVRSQSTAISIGEQFATFGGRFEARVIPDYMQEDSFDDVVRGVDCVLHIASPCHFDAKEPWDIIRPAVTSTVNILGSCMRAGNSVKRLVITSSTAAIYGNDWSKHVWTESDWNDDSLRECELKGPATDPRQSYLASKEQAERAAWNFMSQHQQDVQFDLVVLNPPWIFGPTLTPEKMGLSLRLWRDAISGTNANPETNEVIPDNNWIDVRDLAVAHVLALQKEQASGHRILVSAGPYTWQDWVDTAHTLDPRLPKKNPQYDKANYTYPIRLDTNKASSLLGVQYRSQEDTTRDILAQFESSRGMGADT